MSSLRIGIERFVRTHAGRRDWGAALTTKGGLDSRGTWGE